MENQHLLYPSSGGNILGVKCCEKLGVKCCGAGSHAYGKLIKNMHCKKLQIGIRVFWLCDKFRENKTLTWRTKEKDE